MSPGPSRGRSMDTCTERIGPQPGDVRPVEEYLLERATSTRAHAEREVDYSVTVARSKSVFWQRIGEILGHVRPRGTASTWRRRGGFLRASTNDPIAVFRDTRDS